MAGWIKLHRSTINWEWSSDPSTFNLWMHILLRANFKSNIYKGYAVPAGSLIIGRKKLAEQTGLTEQQVRTSISRLKRSGNLTIKTTNKFSIITVVNWDLYQNMEHETTSTLTNEQPTTNQQLTTLEEGNNTIKEEDKYYRDSKNETFRNKKRSYSDTLADTIQQAKEKLQT